MDGGIKEKGKRGLFNKTWERCRSIGRGGAVKRASSSPPPPPLRLGAKSKSWPRLPGKQQKRVAPEGCFSVYVGPQKQKFVVKTEYANHPLFRMLLEEAELEYGYNSQGPLLLPCDVDLFYRVLMEMDCDDGDEGIGRRGGGGCAFGSPYRLLNPSRSLLMNHF